MKARFLGAVLIITLILGLTFSTVKKTEAYYGSSLYGSGLYGSGLYGSSLYGSSLYGSSLYGMYGSGLYGMSGMYGMGGLYGMYGMYGSSLYGSSLYGMYGSGLYGMSGMYGMYGMGGLYGMYGSSMMNPFGFQNMYYSIDTGSGLSYQVPFLQIAPLLGMAGMYNSLFPSLFNAQSITSTAPTTGTATP